MLELERTGRAQGAGFYDYPTDGRKHLWPGLAEVFSPRPGQQPIADLKDRLLYSQALETVRILDEGVLRRVGDANLGSILGLGYPAWTGGDWNAPTGFPDSQTCRPRVKPLLRPTCKRCSKPGHDRPGF